jgi:hypothetical protein
MATSSPTVAQLVALLDRLTLGDKLQRLAKLHASDIEAIELIVNDALLTRWLRLIERGELHTE